jgi:uncharacterized protein YkwD
VIKFLKLIFFPHPDNNHKAFLLQPGITAILIAVYLLNQSFIKSFTIVRPGVLGYSSEITSQKVYDLTNARRLKEGQPALHYNPILSESATAKAQDMFEHNYWSHNSPEGRTPWDFFKQANYQYSIAGENLAKDFYDTESMMKAWINSPTHHANIVNSKYQEIGIGVVNGVLNGVKTTLVVQHFGSPQNGIVYTTSAEESVLVENSRVLAQSNVPETSSKFMISPLQISQFIGLIMFVVIIFTLGADIWATLKSKTHRLSSSSLSHIGFLAIILMLLLFTRQGSIIF